MSAEAKRRPDPRPFERPVYVTRPMLPNRAAYDAHLDDIWESAWLANNGAKHRALEAALSRHLGAANLSLFANGTLALTVACRALELSGEVIVTPFTFPATVHALTWQGLTPVFADIEPERMTLDPARVEALVTPRTSAILGVHVYGVPCDLEGLAAVAERHGLRLIYDAAHAFGTTVNGRSIAAFGDASMFSFHATKLFHTAEGGALAVHDEETKRRVDLMKNFGILNEEEVALPGINAKMNELQAALGLANLEVLETERAARAAVRAVYAERLAGRPGVRLVTCPEGVTDSRQYCILRIDPAAAGCHRDTVQTVLKRYNVFTRKYFYPLCSDYDCYRALPSADPAALPVAQRVAGEVLSLPIYGGLSVADAHRICDMIELGLDEGEAR